MPQGNPVSASITNETIRRRFFSIEARQKQMDETVWRDELEARRHEQVFVNLWDSLRSSDDPWKLLEDFPFEEIVFGSPTNTLLLEHGITVSQLSPQANRVDRAAWNERLRTWHKSGYRIEQSEWRHPHFSTPENGKAKSEIAVALHISNSENTERHVIRGNLHVTWTKPLEPTDAPIPEAIDATKLEVLSRSGDPFFDHVAAADFTPETNDAQALEPSLQVYDLDGDGFSEIILPRRNRVLWNKGNGNFQLDDLCAHPVENVGACLIGDFDGDGLADFLAADSRGLALFHGGPAGRFPDVHRQIRFTGEALSNPFVMTTGDVDNDGDLDLWLAQYKVPYQGGQTPTPYYDANDGYPSYLLINDGTGGFAVKTLFSGLAAKRFRRTYSASFVDLDDDHDLDLLVVSDFAGVDIHLNDGQGKFTDSTDRMLNENHCFGMAHTFGDYDRDGYLDFFAIGMNSYTALRLDSMNAGPAEPREYREMRPRMAYGNRMYFRRNSVFELTPLSDQVAQSGWSWGAASGDFDNDGDLDVYVVNGHISGQTVQDYDPQFWCHDIYTGTSTPDPALDLYFQSVQTKYRSAGNSFGGFEKNRLFLNQAGASFAEVGFLMGVSMEEDCRNAVAEDLDGDGKLDLIITTFQVWPEPKQVLHILPNFCDQSGNWIGVRLREAGPGYSPVGAKVTLMTPAGKQVRRFVTGDSYRSQHSTTAHFGIGTEDKVARIEVTWPNGRQKVIMAPEINRYHSIVPTIE